MTWNTIKDMVTDKWHYAQKWSGDVCSEVPIFVQLCRTIVQWLKIGGMLRCGKDGEYIDKIHTIDKTIKDCCAMDSDGNYYVRPSILNWISSKGWKFQQREYVGNGTSRYYFVK